VLSLYDTNKFEGIEWGSISQNHVFFSYLLRWYFKVAYSRTNYKYSGVNMWWIQASITFRFLVHGVKSQPASLYAAQLSLPLDNLRDTGLAASVAVNHNFASQLYKSTSPYIYLKYS
jgi:hypothetical protein